MAKKIDIAEYEAAVNELQGWCTFCKDFTRGDTEGDVEGYDCPKCAKPKVMGAEEALMQGQFEFKE